MATPTDLPASFSAGAVLTAAQMNDLRGAFRILQVVSVTNDTSLTTTGTFPQLSALNASITPQSDTSKILVVANLATWLTSGTSNNKIGIYGISVGSGSTTSIHRIRFSANASGASDFFGTNNLQFLHSPASDSTQVYNVLFGRYSAGFDNTVGLNGDAGSKNADSNITLYELSA
jgi:hypothetical protein